MNETLEQLLSAVTPDEVIETERLQQLIAFDNRLREYINENRLLTLLRVTDSEAVLFWSARHQPRYAINGYGDIIYYPLADTRTPKEDKYVFKLVEISKVPDQQRLTALSLDSSGKAFVGMLDDVEPFTFANLFIDDSAWTHSIPSPGEMDLTLIESVKQILPVYQKIK